MYPVYGYMEPHQIDHNSHPYYHPMPMHYNAMNMSNPTDYNACCNKSYPYGFRAYRPPYSYYQPPPQLYNNPYYHPYFIPPPPPNNHCCGCPNHACHQRENNGVKIVEQSPESEQKKSSDLPNNPYPFVWIPPGFLNDKNMHGGEEKKKTQLPWPMVWMPGNEKPEEKMKELKEINAAPKSVEEPPKFKIIPLKFLENGNEKENKENNKVRSIPVKQVEEMPGMQRQVDDDKKSSVVEAPMEEKEVKKCNSSKQTSPAKSSKLPPVCLRVDPLPRKKGSNGSSRSPSPPAIKETKKDNEKKNIKVVEITDKLPSSVVEQELEKVVADNKKVDGKSSEDENVKKITEEAADSKKSEVRKITKSLSESDAAVLIQSAYRGYEVRRTQVLEKLRKIALVRERIAEVRTQIHQFEASKEMDSKQRAVIGETVMNLLLQLDTIQGLHPDVREIRKSVARELVCLQEKLDALSSCITKGNGSEEVEKQSKDEEDEQKSGAEMTEPLKHEGQSSDSKMVEESQLISDGKETESLDDKIGKSFDPLVSSLCREENEERTTIIQSEPIESANDAIKVLDMQPEYGEQKPNLEEDRLPRIVDEVEKIAAETPTITPEIVQSQCESAEALEKLKLHEDVITEIVAFAEGDKIEKIAEEISEEISEEKLEESDGENSVSAEGNEIAKIAEESLTTNMIPDIVPTLSEHGEISEEKPNSNEESSSITAEESAAMESDIVPTQSEHAEISEDKPECNEESSSIMSSIAEERVAIMTPDIVPSKNESPDEHVVNVQEKRLLEENQKLREMLEKVFEAGKQQLEVISTLNGRVKNLEKKMISSQKRKPRVKRNKISKSSISSAA